MAQKGPGRYYHKGISPLKLAEMFPDEDSATQWFESIFWAKGRAGPRCKGCNTCETKYTNGIESVWAVPKRAYHCAFHHLCKEHLNRYVTQLAGKHNVRDFDTMDQMELAVMEMATKQLRYKDLVA